jgi:hypothetical protein
MNILRHWKIVLCLAAIVVVSGAAGWLAGHRSARQQIEKRNDLESWNLHVAQVFERTAQPSPEQGTKIQAHLDRAVRELQAIRSDTIARSTNVIWRLVAEVEAELTPEQLQAFEAMKPKPGDLTLDVLKVKPPKEDRP